MDGGGPGSLAALHQGCPVPLSLGRSVRLGVPLTTSLSPEPFCFLTGFSCPVTCELKMVSTLLSVCHPHPCSSAGPLFLFLLLSGSGAVERSSPHMFIYSYVG